jgi:hypothetical protein
MASDTDTDFLDRMHALFDMDEKHVEALLDKLDDIQLSDLTDAVANSDKKAARRIIDLIEPDEEENVNALFRGKNLVSKKKKRLKPSDGKETQYAFGDDVSVTFRDKNGRIRHKTGTVSKTEGPQNTNSVVVSIEGKDKVIPKDKVARLAEGVLGMTNVPDLTRMQQLAGIQPQVQPEAQVQAIAVEEVPAGSTGEEVDQNDPLCQAMCALETLEGVLPNIRLCDIKDVRARIVALQTMMNESVRREAGPLGRRRKH